MEKFYRAYYIYNYIIYYILYNIHNPHCIIFTYIYDLKKDQVGSSGSIFVINPKSPNNIPKPNPDLM